MVHRSQKLQEFLTATREAIAARTGANAPAATAMQRVSASMDVPASASDFAKPRTLPACAHFDPAIVGAMHGPGDIARVASAIKGLAPELCWKFKASDDPVFANGHANADILGRYRSSRATGQCLDRIELDGSRNNLSGSLSSSRGSVPCTFARLMKTRASAWHEPGLGGIVYNPRGITHAMRSSCQPFLAIWCLPID